MASTKKILAEQVMFKLEGGWPDIAAAVQEEDLYKRIEQKVNAKAKLQHFNQTLASGETIPDGLFIATYDGISVSSYQDRSKATLPVKPISLPRNMGIFRIYNEQYPDNDFIPLQRGQMALLRSDVLLNDLIGDIGYEPRNEDVVFSKDLTLMGVSEVSMELVVMDMSLFSVTQALPIPADMEEEIVNELVAEYAPVQPETGAVNKFTTIKNNPAQ
jgi:hypothetical protein